MGGALLARRARHMPVDSPHSRAELGGAGPSPARALRRIVHLLAPADVGGLEHVVLSLATGQARRGHDVSAIGFNYEGRTDHPFAQQLISAGVAARVVPIPARGYLGERRTIRALLRALRPDVVHSHGMRVDVMLGGIPRSMHIPAVSTVHGMTGGDWKMRLYQRIHLASLRNRDAVIAVSRPLVELLALRGVSRERVHFIANAWSGASKPLSREAARRELHVSLDPSMKIVGFLGRLSREKGADVLIEAMASLRDPLVHAVFIGDGPERAALEALAARLGVSERLHLCGIIHGAARLMKAFDVFALTSRTEGTPIALLEAMAHGVPVVATEVGGVPDVVSTREAMLVASMDAPAVAEAIRTTLDDQPATARRVATASARLNETFAAEPWLDRHDALYNALLRESRGRSGSE